MFKFYRFGHFVTNYIKLKFFLIITLVLTLIGSFVILSFRYYHFGQEKEEDICEETKSFTSRSIQNISESAEVYLRW